MRKSTVLELAIIVALAVTAPTSAQPTCGCSSGYVQPKVLFKDYETFIHVSSPGSLSTVTMQLMKNCDPSQPCPYNCSGVGPTFQATLASGTAIYVVAVPRTVTNDTPPGDYILAIDNCPHLEMKLTVRRTPFIPQVYPDMLGDAANLGTRRHYSNPDGDSNTNDQIVDKNLDYHAWGVDAHPQVFLRPNDQEAIDNIFNHHYHVTVPPSPGEPPVAIEYVGTTHFIAPVNVDLLSPSVFNQVGAGPVCIDGDPCRDEPLSIDDNCFGSWSVFKKLFDDFCPDYAQTHPPYFFGKQPQCLNVNRVSSEPPECVFRADPSTGKPWDDFRAQHIFLDPTLGMMIAYRGQDENETHHVNPDYQIDWANIGPYQPPSNYFGAVLTLASRLKNRLMYWDGLNGGPLNPDYGTNLLDVISWHEPNLQFAETFDYAEDNPTPPPITVRRNRFSGGPGLLYFNSPTYTELDLASFRAFLVANSFCGSHPCPLSQGFPLLPVDYLSSVDLVLKARCAPWDPDFPGQGLYWDQWVQWRYQVIADGYAALAKEAVSFLLPSQRNKIKFMFFGYWGGMKELVHQIDSQAPPDRAWLHLASANVLPGATTGSTCREALFVDNGIDPFVWAKAFEKQGVDLEFITAEGGSRPADDTIQRAANEFNRDHGDVTGQNRFARLKTAAFLDFNPDSDIPGAFGWFHFDELSPRDWDRDQVTSTGACPAPVAYDLSKARFRLAQMKSSGMDYISGGPGGNFISVCDETPPPPSNTGPYEVTRTPYFDMWRSMRENLADAVVRPRAINANLVVNGSFEEQKGQSGLPRYWQFGGSGVVGLVAPGLPGSGPQAFQGERYLQFLGAGTLTSGRILLDPNRTYACQAYAGTTATATLRVTFYDSEDQQVGIWAASTSGAKWSKVGVVTAPATAANLYARVELEAGGGPVDDTEFDNVWFYDATAITSATLDAPNYLENPSMELLEGDADPPAGLLPQGWTPNASRVGGMVLRQSDARTTCPPHCFPDPVARHGARYLTIDATACERHSKPPGGRTRSSSTRRRPMTRPTSPPGCGPSRLGPWRWRLSGGIERTKTSTRFSRKIRLAVSPRSPVGPSFTHRSSLRLGPQTGR